MPPAVEPALHRVLGWVNAKPAPIDFYLANRDALVEAEYDPPRGQPHRHAEGPPAGTSPFQIQSGACQCYRAHFFVFVRIRS